MIIRRRWKRKRKRVRRRRRLTVSQTSSQRSSSINMINVHIDLIIPKKNLFDAKSSKKKRKIPENRRVHRSMKNRFILRDQNSVFAAWRFIDDYSERRRFILKIGGKLSSRKKQRKNLKFFFVIFFYRFYLKIEEIYFTLRISSTGIGRRARTSFVVTQIESTRLQTFETNFRRILKRRKNKKIFFFLRRAEILSEKFRSSLFLCWSNKIVRLRKKLGEKNQTEEKKPRSDRAFLVKRRPSRRSAWNKTERTRQSAFLHRSSKIEPIRTVQIGNLSLFLLTFWFSIVGQEKNFDKWKTTKIYLSSMWVESRCSFSKVKLITRHETRRKEQSTCGQPIFSHSFFFLFFWLWTKMKTKRDEFNRSNENSSKCRPNEIKTKDFLLHESRRFDPNRTKWFRPNSQFKSLRY